MAALAVPGQATATILTFDDLPLQQAIPETYGGIVWEVGMDGYSGHTGSLIALSAQDGAYPKTQPVGLVNEWGVRRVVIRFESGQADFHGAWFGRYGDLSSFWAGAVGFVGFRTEDDPCPYLAAMTLSTKPAPLYVDFRGVVKVQITAAAGANGSGGWYTLDDLSYTPVPEPASVAGPGGALLWATSRVLSLRRCRRDQAVLARASRAESASMPPGPADAAADSA